MHPDVGKVKMSKIVDQEINQKYVDFENSGIITRYKIGILYAKEGQTTDDEMFSNGGEEPPSEDYLEFLDWIGTKVELKGFDKYRGGLDVKSTLFFFEASSTFSHSFFFSLKDNTTGLYSVYTTLKEFEIMV